MNYKKEICSLSEKYFIAQNKHQYVFLDCQTILHHFDSQNISVTEILYRSPLSLTFCGQHIRNLCKQNKKNKTHLIKGTCH